MVVSRMVRVLLAPVFAAGLMWASVIAGPVLSVARADILHQVCPDPAAQLDAWIQRANDHNSRTGSVNAYDHAAVDVFNAEKVQLEADRSALMPRIDACDAAVAVLTPKDPSGLQLATPTAAQRLAIDDARKGIPAGYQPPAVRKGDRETMPKDAPERPLYEALRGDSSRNVPKDIHLAGAAAPPAGAPDPAYPGQKIGETPAGDAKVVPDHIVPLAELIKLPGFLKLTSDQMYLLSQVPLNFQWMSWTANTAEYSGSAARMLPEADRSWAGKQIQLQNETRNQLQDIIDNLVRANGE
ncbi:hypothetical protein A5779_02680 [Mycolicibacterium peregrinum]|uniref:Uncharacterized protein n=1 Tax=Mycolicibacterium peregrinum TaxID=43304 RepID=A0A1A0VTQ9_MYCPR|nr:hypothetical protein A5779_02680 [Mycolicibacterium peregrinum]